MGCEMIWTRQAKDKGLSILHNHPFHYISQPAPVRRPRARELGLFRQNNFRTILFVKNGRVFLAQRRGDRKDLTRVITSEAQRARQSPTGKRERLRRKRGGCHAAGKTVRRLATTQGFRSKAPDSCHCEQSAASAAISDWQKRTAAAQEGRLPRRRENRPSARKDTRGSQQST